MSNRIFHQFVPTTTKVSTAHVLPTKRGRWILCEFSHCQKFIPANNICEKQETKLAPVEKWINSCDVESLLPTDYTVLTGFVTVNVLGQTSALECKKTFSGDTFTEALEKAHKAGARQLERVL